MRFFLGKAVCQQEFLARHAQQGEQLFQRRRGLLLLRRGGELRVQRRYLRRVHCRKLLQRNAVGLRERLHRHAESGGQFLGGLRRADLLRTLREGRSFRRGRSLGHRRFFRERRSLRRSCPLRHGCPFGHSCPLRHGRSLGRGVFGRGFFGFHAQAEHLGAVRRPSVRRSRGDIERIPAVKIIFRDQVDLRFFRLAKLHRRF